MRSSMTAGALLALAAASCTPAAAPAPSTPPPSTTSVGTASPVATPRPTGLAAALDVHVKSWHPDGPTAIVTAWSPRTTEIVAVPLDGTPFVSLATVRDVGDMPALVRPRRDGQAFAITLATGLTTRRIALLDLANGTSRWLSDPGPGETDYGAAWASDGLSVYFGRTNASGDLGVIHAALDGTLIGKLPPASFYGANSNVMRVTPEGVLVGSDEFNGPTLWLLDLASGRKTSFGAHYSMLASWRSKAPRALVAVLTNIAAPGAGYLALWDDLTDARTTLLDTPVGGADFDPTGGRVVAAATDPSDQRPRLLVMNTDGSAKSFLAGTDFARSPRWTSDGIVYLRYEPNVPDQIDLVVPYGGPRRTVYTAFGVQQFQLVAPVVADAPAGFTLPPGCSVVSAAASTGGVSRWAIDCGPQRNAGARGTLEPTLRDAGWQLCGSGLASASWRKGELVTVISELADPAASFTLSQRTGASCP